MLRFYYNFETLWKKGSYYCILCIEVIFLKKIKCLIITAFAAAACWLTAVNAYAGTIRVGLEKNFKNVESVTINDSVMGVGIGSGKKYNISGTYTVKPVGGQYYNIGEYFDTYEEVYAKLPAYTGYNCVAALTDKGWTIYVRTDGKKLNKTIISTGSYCVGFAYEGKYKFIVDGSSPARVNASDGIIGVGENFYRDDIEIYRQGSTLTAVNVIDEEKYLYGVINSEMPSSWSSEAQKAQAVAARTYMERSKGKHDIYDLCDGVHCQDYNGTKNETEAGIQAVNETEGLCIYYNDALIEAVYFASDGGATIDGAEAWGTETPYLKGKVDTYEKEYKEWTREFTYSELTDIFAAKGYDVGNVVKLEVKYNANGIATELTIRGSKGQKVLTKEEIRTAFSTSSGGSLNSRNFVLLNGEEASGSSVYALGSNGNTNTVGSNAAVQSSGKTGLVAGSIIAESSKGTSTITTASTAVTGKAGVVTIAGKGNGHSVGMSQYGAKGMAEDGYKFDDILKFYYTDVEIK